MLQGLAKSTVRITCTPKRQVWVLPKYKANWKEPKYHPGKSEGNRTPGKYRESQKVHTGKV